MFCMHLCIHMNQRPIKRKKDYRDWKDVQLEHLYNVLGGLALRQGDPGPDSKPRVQTRGTTSPAICDLRFRFRGSFFVLLPPNPGYM